MLDLFLKPSGQSLVELRFVFNDIDEMNARRFEHCSTDVQAQKV